jgi:hypothetical protein
MHQKRINKTISAGSCILLKTLQRQTTNFDVKNASNARKFIIKETLKSIVTFKTNN